MTIWTFTICRNSADLVRFWLRHYDRIADVMFVWDDNSTDGTKEILQEHRKVVCLKWPYDTGIDEDRFLQFAYEQYPNAEGCADWVMWVDMDEFIYHPQLTDMIQDVDSSGYNVIRPDGFNMMHDGIPHDDGRQIWEVCNTGVAAPVYSKPVIFKPSSGVRWNRGKHELEHCQVKLAEGTGIKLLHYRYLGYEYTKQRNLNNYSRVPGDKAAAWTCNPDWHGEHSPDWAAQALKLAKPII